MRRRMKRFVIEDSSVSRSAASSCSASVAPGSLPTRIGEAYRLRNVYASPELVTSQAQPIPWLRTAELLQEKTRFTSPK